MNAILRGANTRTHKQQVSQLIVELGKSITNPQRQTLSNFYIAVDTAYSVLQELEQAHQIIRQCMREMDDEQILEVAKLNQNNNLSSLWAFRTHQRQKMIERAQRVLFGAGHVPG
ncbi:hypothetical protein RFY44_19965 [Acinetobacter bereziniae]|jgi:translation elongation factor EF-Tu-like GTPase|uniref:hypothetical protein n=1 Tax=Acinetobacter bereziniae TaxID=106648 RepID=UPI002812CF55|nr:hypothetical protein [Acinetobacter bereziniae]MDQ9821125.1 hypothetical protein [Acinetobacter bereziniae]